MAVGRKILLPPRWRWPRQPGSRWCPGPRESNHTRTKWPIQEPAGSPRRALVVIFEPVRRFQFVFRVPLDAVGLRSPVAELDQATAVAAKRHVGIVERNFPVANGAT